MPPLKPVNVTKSFKRLLVRIRPGKYVLRLYVTGMTPRSARAIATLKTVCEEHLAGRYELEVIDIYQQPALARDEQIVAAPTLVKELPPPARWLIGDLSNKDPILRCLDLRRKPGAVCPAEDERGA
jgi:circadian clock protein KaiB